MFMSILATVQLVCIQLLSAALGFEADAFTPATANGSVTEATATQSTLAPPPTGVSTTPPPSLPLGYLPHIVFFLADDWGHFNMGWRGNQEARTPNIDGLVQEGIVLDRPYVYQFCSPTRSAAFGTTAHPHQHQEHGPHRARRSRPAGLDHRRQAPQRG